MCEMIIEMNLLNHYLLPSKLYPIQFLAKTSYLKEFHKINECEYVLQSYQEFQFFEVKDYQIIHLIGFPMHPCYNHCNPYPSLSNYDCYIKYLIHKLINNYDCNRCKVLFKYYCLIVYPK